MNSAIAQRLSSACAIGVIQWGRSTFQKDFYFGRESFFDDAEHISKASLFDVASLTKLVTSCLVHRAVERGVLSLETPISNYFARDQRSSIPEFVTIARLLNHTSTLPAWKPFYENFRKYFATEGDPYEVQKILEIPLTVRKQYFEKLLLGVPFLSEVKNEPIYSDLGFMYLSLILEKVYSQCFSKIVDTDFIQPLGLKKEEFHFRPIYKSIQNKSDSIVATEKCPWRGLLKGQVHDDNAWCMGGVAGHAGVFSTLPAMMSFFSKLNSGQYLSLKALQKMWQPLNGRTLGWDLVHHPQSSAGQYFSENSVGHLGFTGTSLWFDRIKKLLVIVFTNRVHPTRSNLLEIKEFRPIIHDAIYLDIRNN